MADGAGSNTKKLSMIVTKGSLDWAYPPFILATTAAAMGLEVSMFFTFYGLTLLKKKLDLQVTTLGNPAMQMPMLGMHIGMPNIVSAIPGVDAAASVMMKNLIKKKGVASIEELRDMAVEAEVEMIACQMTMDLFEYTLDDMIAGAEARRRGDLHRKRHQERHQPVHLSSTDDRIRGNDMADQLLDVKGLNCPLPILRAKKALKDIPMGGTLEVLATDPGAVKDFEAFCRTTGNELVEFEGGRQGLQLRHQADGVTPGRRRHAGAPGGAADPHLNRRVSAGISAPAEKASVAAIAQLVEHRIRNAGVGGSSPSCGTNKPMSDPETWVTDCP